MKTKKSSIARTLLPTVLCCMLALPVVGFSGTASAAEKKVSEPVKTEQTISVVNINKADAQTLSQVLKGVGDKKAQAIVAWRQQYGEFTSVNQLLEIKGIAEKTLAANKGRIQL